MSSSCGNSDCPKTALPLASESQALCAGDLFKRFRDSTVNISVIPKFNISDFGFLENSTGPTVNTLYQLLPLSYSGFFYEKNGFIVSSSAFLYTLILALYALYSPFDDQSSRATPLPCPGGVVALPTVEQVIYQVFNPNSAQSLMDFFDIYITVFNVNGCGPSYVYRGCMVGVDFDTGVAVYRIDPCDAWNKCSAPIRTLPYLKFGVSKCYTPGNPVHVIAALSQNSPQTMASGTVVNNTNSVTNGNITYESIVTDIAGFAGYEGAPIIDQCGYVVGVVTGLTNVANPFALNQPSSYSAVTVFGVTSGFINHVVSKLIENAMAPNCSKSVFYSAIFGVAIYRHATLGLTYYYRTGSDIAILSSDVTYPQPILRQYDPAYCEINRQLAGIVVRNVYGAVSEVIEPCTRQNFPAFSSGKIQPQIPATFEGWCIEPLDLITGINGLQLGQLPNQVVLDTIMYQTQPCQTVSIEFMKICESYTQCHNLCSNVDDNLAFLFNMPDVYSQITCTGGNLATIAGPLLAWFLNSVSQVYRVNFLQYVIDTPDDSNILLNNINNSYDVPVIPGVSVNINYLNPVSLGCNTNTFLTALNDSQPVSANYVKLQSLTLGYAGSAASTYTYTIPDSFNVIISAAATSATLGYLESTSNISYVSSTGVLTVTFSSSITPNSIILYFY